MALFKNGSFVADDWRTVGEGEAAPAAGHVIFTLEWWKQERHVYDGSNVAIGLLIEPATTPLEPLIQTFLIARVPGTQAFWHSALQAKTSLHQAWGAANPEAA